VLTEGRVTVGESVRGETQVERSVLCDQSHQLNLAEHVGMGLEGDTIGIARDPESCAEFDQCGGEPVEVGIIR
jgi:hypothetical protein